MSERASCSRRETTTSDSRCSRRRSAGGDGGTTLFRSARSDEDGGNQANIAASGASNRYRAMREQLNSVRCASSSAPTREICITFRKTRTELVEISLHRVMNPLLFRTASTV